MTKVHGALLDAAFSLCVQAWRVLSTLSWKLQLNRSLTVQVLTDHWHTPISFILLSAIPKRPAGIRYDC